MGEPTCAALTWLEGIVREAGCTCLGNCPTAPRRGRPNATQARTTTCDRGKDHEDDGGEELISGEGVAERISYAMGDPELIDDIMLAVIAEFPSDVSDPEALRLHSRAIDLVSEAQIIVHGLITDRDKFNRIGGGFIG